MAQSDNWQKVKQSVVADCEVGCYILKRLGDV